MGDEVEATQKVLVERLQASGEFDKIKAMVLAASIKCLADEDDDTFKRSKALLRAKENALAFQVVGDWLRHLGLNYTFNVLALEAGFDTKTLDEKRSAIAKKVPGTTDNSATPILDQLITAGANGHGATTAAPATAAGATTAAAPQKPAAAETKPAAPTAVAKQFPNCTTLPNTKDAVAKAGRAKGGEESVYEIFYFDKGTFTRFNQIANQPLNIAELRNCKVICYDPLDSMQIDECENCEIVVAGCEGSIFLRDSKNMKLTVACKQLRLRDSHDIDVRLFATTDPVVESSARVTIRPFNLRLPNLNATLAKAKLNPNVNRFVHIYDFTPAYEPRPHFTVQHPKHGLEIEELGAEYGKPELPAQLEDIFYNRIQPTESTEAGPNKSFDIKTGSGAWANELGTGTGTPTQPPAAPPAAATATKAAPAPKPATTAPAPKPAAKPAAASGILSRDSDDDKEKYSDFSGSDASSAMSSVHDKDDSEDEF
jgi:protein XRP2